VDDVPFALGNDEVHGVARRRNTVVASCPANSVVDLARRELDNALRFHPNQFNIRRVRLELGMFSDPPADALRRLHDPSLTPQYF